MDCVGTVKGQSEDEDGVRGAGDDGHKVRGPHHAGTRAAVHQGGIMQRPADGSIAVIGHGGEQAAFCDAKEDKEIQLGEADGRWDGGAGGEEISQHPGHDGCCVKGLHHGEVAEEEIHGRVQGRVHQCEEEDQGVAQQGDQVDAEHPPEQRAPKGTKTGEPQQNKLSYYCAIVTFHVPKAKLVGARRGLRLQQKRRGISHKHIPLIRSGMGEYLGC